MNGSVRTGERVGDDEDDEVEERDFFRRRKAKDGKDKERIGRQRKARQERLRDDEELYSTDDEFSMSSGWGYDETKKHVPYARRTMRR